MNQQVETAPARFSAVPALPQDIKPPIIIIGMHRSGTSLVAGMLTALGIFVDPAAPPPKPGETPTPPSKQQRRDGYGEATFFRLLNDMVLARSGASWDHVEPFLHNRGSSWMTRTNLFLMKRHMQRRFPSDFLGPMPAWASGNWGWKDPRNSMTLPYWLRLFPQARILHVRREPENVAASLMRRVSAPETQPVVQGERLKALGKRLVLHPSGVAASVGRRLGLPTQSAGRQGSVSEREYCLYLSDLYVQECLRYRALGNRYMEVEYEEILCDPISNTLRMACFAEAQTSEARILQAARLVQKSS
ncbi:MAG TPA: sulfotransferase [Chthonomonadaceae bacterium]|nr:sulfotransferase [Chthonomonadaceae bacterium]